MPKRITNRRIESPELQGDDSYIVIKEMSWKTGKQAAKFIGRGNVEADQSLTVQEQEAQIQKEIDFTEDLIIDHLIGWNWVGDDDKPLPLPKSREELHALDLTGNEVSFIVTAITQPVRKDEQKNSESGS